MDAIYIRLANHRGEVIRVKNYENGVKKIFRRDQNCLILEEESDAYSVKNL